MKIAYYPVLSKPILTILLVSVFIAIAWPQKTETAVDNIADSSGLHQKIIVIDPGHGGADPGAVADELVEAEVNMILSLALKDELQRNGAIVKLTRYGNKGLVPEKTMTNYERWNNLKQRKDYALKQECDILISIHVNSDKDPRTSGSMVFYHENSSRELAAVIQEELNNLGLRPRKPIKSNFTVINNLDIPAILIEAGFITNNRDRALILDEPFMIAHQICNGIIKFENKKQLEKAKQKD